MPAEKAPTQYSLLIGLIKFILSPALILLSSTTLVAGQGLGGSLEKTSTLEKLKALELARLDEGAITQARIDTIDDERRNLSNEYRMALKQHEDLKKYNTQLEKVIQSQRDEAESLKNQINRIGRLERDIVPLMTDMLDALDSFITLDLPFLLEERRTRLQNLRVLMTQANVTNAEKYRRILEAYQIENDYGRSIEAYEGRLENNQGQTVTFLKIGRVALLYQTLDGQLSYRWSMEEQQWQQLDSDFNSQVRDGIKMAREQMPPNLLLVPVRMM